MAHSTFQVGTLINSVQTSQMSAFLVEFFSLKNDGANTLQGGPFVGPKWCQKFALHSLSQCASFCMKTVCMCCFVKEFTFCKI